MKKNYTRTNPIILTIFIILVSCINNSNELTEPEIVKNNNINDVNNNNYQLEDSIFQLYDSLSKVMWDSNDNLMKLESTSDKKIDDIYYLRHEMYLQDVFQNQKKLFSLESICDSLNIPTVNFRVFRNIDNAIKFVDSCIIIQENNLKNDKDSNFLNQIMTDRERLVKLKERIYLLK